MFPQQTEDQVKLLRNQRRLEEEFSRPYLDLSLHQTLRKLVAEGNHKVVEQMRKEFKVPDRRCAGLQALTHRRHLCRGSPVQLKVIALEPHVSLIIE